MTDQVSKPDQNSPSLSLRYSGPLSALVSSSVEPGKVLRQAEQPSRAELPVILYLLLSSWKSDSFNAGTSQISTAA